MSQYSYCCNGCYHFSMWYLSLVSLLQGFERWETYVAAVNIGGVVFTSISPGLDFWLIIITQMITQWKLCPLKKK